MPLAIDNHLSLIENHDIFFKYVHSVSFLSSQLDQYSIFDKVVYKRRTNNEQRGQVLPFA